MPDETNAVPGNENPGPVTPVPAPTTGGQAPAAAPPQADEGMKRFTGLQDSLNAMLKRTGWGSLKDIPNQADVQQWQQSHGALGGLQKEKADKDADFEIQSGELSGLRAENQKLQMLLDPKYAGLARFHAHIETKDTPAEQEQAIQAFQATLQGYVAGLPQGAPPPPGATPPAGSGLTTRQQMDQARAEYEQTLMAGKPPEEVAAKMLAYSKLADQYHKELGVPDKYAAPRGRSIE